MQLPKMLVAMWRMGFFFHEVAFGLLSVFIPLYIVALPDVGLLGGKLLAVGIMTSVALFCAIPGSFLWGFLCDATRRYKVFILLSFASSAAILFLMTLPFAQSIVLFVVLYVVMQVLHVAHEAPKNVLIAEHYSREEWEKSYGFYEALTEVGFIAGLVIGMIAFLDNIGANYVFYLCSGLSVVALILAVALIADPLMIFERRLVGIEKRIDFTARGLDSSSRMMDGLGYDGSLKQDSFVGFAIAIVMFSLATSLFFTPLPLFLNQGLGLAKSWVYVAYILNSVGATVGYTIASRRARSMDIRKQMPRFILLRGGLVFLLVGAIQLAIFPNILTGLFLMGLGFAYAMYYILMLSLSMELIPEGKAGLFDGLVGLGAAVGAFLGPFLAEMINYVPMFIIAAVIFIIAFVAIKLS
jgi:MFS family permease